MTDYAKSTEVLQGATESLGIELPSVLSALEVTRLKVDEAAETARESLAKLRGDDEIGPIDIVAFGSVARGEVSEAESDFDHALIAYHRVENPIEIYNVRQAANDVAENVFSRRTSSFGGFSSALDLVNLIGLEGDTNRHQTHRLLLLEESTSLLNPSEHSQLLRSLLQRYLFDYLIGADRKPREKRGVPRFLLNDVIRYWRTIAVDYQGKRWEEMRGQKWGMRYLKLRSTRKLLFVGTVVSLFLPKIRNIVVDPSFLQEQFSLSPLARFAQLAEHLSPGGDGETQLRKALELGDYFLQRFGDSDFRRKVEPVEIPAASKVPEFVEARARTSDLEIALEALFGSTEPLVRPEEVRDALTLRELTDRYLLF